MPGHQVPGAEVGVDAEEEHKPINSDCDSDHVDNNSNATDGRTKHQTRTRFCKTCSFSCRDSAEFTQHQACHSLENGDESSVGHQATRYPIRPRPKGQALEQAALRLRKTRRPETMAESEGLNLSSSAAFKKSGEEPEADSENQDQNMQTEIHVLNGNGTRDYETKENISEEEDRDEPDAMSPTARDENIGNDFSVAGVNGNHSGDEDMDDEGRLVIDDENSRRRLLRKRKLHNGVPETLDATTNGEAESNGIDDSDSRVNISNNFLGVTAESLTHSEQGNVMPSNFNLGNDEEDVDDAELPSLIRDDSASAMEMATSFPLGLAANDMDNLDRAYEEDKRKKKKTRQEVDPGKYFEAVDSAGTKYACSQCGNIYKWRKSLNKHWKEKHSQDPLVDSPSPPGMLELLKSGKYTQLGSRRIYDNNFLATIKTQKDDGGTNSVSTGMSNSSSTSAFHPRASASAISPGTTVANGRPSTYGQQIAVPSPSPTNFLALNQAHRFAASVASLMPNTIGRIVGQPVFPNMMFPLPHPFQQQQQQAAAAATAAAAALAQQQNSFNSQEEGALDLSRDSRPPSMRNSPSPASPQPGPSNSRVYSPEPDDQDQPLDFSKKSSSEQKPSSSKSETHRRKSESRARRENNGSSDVSCSSDTEPASHQVTHMNKRIIRCYECSLQVRSMEELNTHFMRAHGRKITDLKEALKKIPHGLQQTYHLLSMDINDIANSERSLKCNKCTFVAKWPAELQKHAVSHSEERPYVCMVCGSTYKWKWDLVKHFQKSHPNLPNPYRRNDKQNSPDCSSDEESEDPELKRARLMMMKMAQRRSRRSAGGSNRPSPSNVESNPGTSAEAAATASRGESSFRVAGIPDAVQRASTSGADDGISVEGIIAATQAGQRVVSSQPNILDDEPATSMERSMAFLRSLPIPGVDPSTMDHTSHAAHFAHVVQAAQVAQMAQAAQEMIDRRNRAQRAVQDSMRQRQNGTTPYINGGTNNLGNGNNSTKKAVKEGSSSSAKQEELPYKCTMCNYHARWPSEVTQHMKNHSDSKPYLCPRCDYRSKWKWDVVKHLKRCGGGGINDVIDTTKMRKKDSNASTSSVSSGSGPPNAVVSHQGRVKKTTPQPAPGPAIILPSVGENGIQGATVVRQPQQLPHNFLSPILPAPADEQNRPVSSLSGTLDLTTNGNRSTADNNNDSTAQDNNVNNNYSAYANGQPNFLQQQHQQRVFALAQAAGAFITPPHVSTSIAISGNASASPSASSATTLPNSTSRQSAEMWNCPHCPFSTASQAELKRHSGLHSEDKPFKCDVCQYSTRWACDLKKHRKSYNHFPENKPVSVTGNTPTPITKKIQLETSKPTGNQEKTAASTENEDIGPSPGRFKCSPCNLFFHTMQKLIEHRTSEHIGLDSAQSSPAPGSQQGSTDQGGEIDAARIKHPRKAIKQIQCPKCEFVCKSRQVMDKHMAEHEELDNSGFSCFYCKAQFRDKDCLLDHLTTHAAFNPGEWETFFMTSEEEDLQLRAKAKAESKASTSADHDQDKSNLENGNSENKPQQETPAPFPVPVSSITSTEERIQKILSEVPKQISSANQQKHSPQENKYKCEWCTAQFASLTAVFKHASQAHPIQLREQETGTVAPQVLPVASSTPKNKNHQGPLATESQQPQLSPKKVYTGEPLEILKQQIAEKRNHHLAEKYNDMMQARLASVGVAQMPHILLQPPHINTGVKEEACEKGEVPHYNCEKCNFSTPSKSTFLRHSELHGATMPSKCWFCDYSVDHMQLLYQHMKISHTRKWKALSQDPKYAEAVYRMTMMYGNAPQGSNNNDSPPLQDGTNGQMLSPNKFPLQLSYLSYPSNASGDDGGVMDLSSQKGKPLADTNSVIPDSDISFKQRIQYSWNGIPINVSTSGPTVQFKCPHCPAKDESVAKACCHVAMSHPPMARFRCRACHHSENSIPLLIERCRITHCPQERTVEVLEIKALQVNEADMAQFNILRAKMFQDLVLANAHSSMTARVEKVSPLSNNKLLTCPFCPYKTQSPQEMKLHVANHSRLARYRCQFCDFSTDNPDVISNHMRVHDPNYTGETNGTASQSSFKTEPVETPKSSPEKVVKAEQRDKAEISEKDAGQTQSGNSPLFNHYKLNGGRMRYRCSACPYRTTCKSNIIKHKRQHQHNKRYKCTKCSYSAARAVLLKNHMEAHDTPVSDGEGQHNDIFCDPHSPGNALKCDENEDNDMNEEAEMEIDDMDDDDACSDELNEMDAKAIADLEAKDIMEAEAAQKAVDDKLQAGLDLSVSHSTLQQKPSDSDSDESFVQSEADKSANITQSPQAKEAAQNMQEFSSDKASDKKSLDIPAGGNGLKKRYLCDFCDWSSDSISLLLQHRKLHKDEPGYTAVVEDPEQTLLNTEFEEGASGEFEAKIMDTRAKEGDPTVSSPAPVPPFKLTVVKKSFPCKACPFKTNSRSSFAAHKAMHGSGEEFSCPHCSFQAKNQGVLQQHSHLHQVSPTNASPSTPDGSLDASSSEAITNEIKSFTKSSAAECAESEEVSSDTDSAATKPVKENGDTELNLLATNNNFEKSREDISPVAAKPTRVYVCQYCEREFEAKYLMIQHEKQHLVESQ
ncbi:suppressor of presenilin protein 4 [Elysia marginata]|uniref:Suppressor of presenilin protein 4 n=1 Tax=Elysia marginata TaxID=1093978 RepID=A0AAV4F7C5_9GAST|nr:suppressor of presenilin protein 4 [Elysia marginata]